MRQTDAIPEATQTAKKQLAAGDISGAEQLLSQQRQITPQDRETHYYYCVCLRYLNRLPDARGELETLLSRFPRFARGYQEMGYTLKALSDQPKALSSFRTAVTLNDALLGSWRALIELTSTTSKPAIYDEAVTQTRNLEGLPKALLQVRDWINEGRLAQAEQLCRQFLIRHPKQVEGMRLLAYIGVQTEVLDDAEVLLENAVRFEPDNDLARYDYMGVLYKRQKYAASFEQAERLIQKAPENIRHQTAYANQCVAIGRFDEAIEIYDRVIPQVTDPAMVHLLKAHALKTIDQSEQAITAYRAAYENKPGFGDAFWSLANLKTYRFTDLEVEAMLTSVAEPNLSPVDHVHLNFALGKHFEDGKDFEQAFAFYQQGNNLKQRQIGYDGELLSQRLNLQTTVCDDVLFKQRKNSGCQAPDPIFIVGLPRSGSTLLEQILASHPQVDGTQELPNIAAFAFELDGRRRLQDAPQYPACLTSIPDSELAAMGQKYLDDTQIHRGQAPFFIDKMPNNFRHIGLIQLILPNAKIIDARRHPMACCFSGFKQLFASGQEFSYSLEDIGRYYQDYISLMNHWHRVLPGKILTVHHEAVVFDLEAQVRQLLAFCGLAFDPACLNFHQTERSVRTPSSEQVRQPIYQSGLEAWMGFEPWLAPLKAAIGDAVLEDYPIFGSN
jgi:tetratricopeptide (TPR) repeat protein|tara:strand:+ start:3584 stop:5593 length:2010 start_codon:yes stop_codon:yes gene_type:complete